MTLTPEGRHLASGGIADLAALLDRVAHGPNRHMILPTLTRLAAAARAHCLAGNSDATMKAG